MKQWNGMVRKEWVTMKWPLIVSALVAITVMAVFPFLITGFLATEVHVFEFALVICFLWAGASVFAPVTALFTMLGSEMKRPDIWLHSNASIFKLIGSKAFMALMIGVGGLLIPTTVLAVHYALSKSTMFSFDELLFFGTIFIVICFAASIVFMSVGFFFWVINRLQKPYVKGFSIVITIILFLISARVYGQFVLSELYQKLVMVGPIDLLALINPAIVMDFVYFEHTETLFYTGEILFSAFSTVALFVVAAVLFEKKVRL